MMMLGELDFIEIVKEALGGSRRRRQITGMPNGAKIVDWWLSPEYLGIAIAIQHESFPRLEPGARMESIVPYAEILPPFPSRIDFVWDGTDVTYGHDVTDKIYFE